ncbi:MAG: hypothetical protein H0X43_13680 [Nitrosospira sp.]|nr:hypothetical protein [Nitrosospira sp.]
MVDGRRVRSVDFRLQQFRPLSEAVLMKILFVFDRGDYLNQSRKLLLDPCRAFPVDLLLFLHFRIVPGPKKHCYRPHTTSKGKGEGGREFGLSSTSTYSVTLAIFHGADMLLDRTDKPLLATPFRRDAASFNRISS